MAMTVGECEAQVLRLLDEEGATDYAQRMYKFIDEAQRVIATTWGFIRKKATLTATDGETVPLPEDCYRIDAIRGGSYEREPVETEGGLWRDGVTLSGSKDGVYTLLYYAYPETIGENDSAKLIQLAPEYYAALCCYVAALTQDNEYDKRAYQIFMERYNNEVALVERARSATGKAQVIILV